MAERESRFFLVDYEEVYWVEMQNVAQEIKIRG